MTRAESLQIYRSWEALWEDNVPLDIPGLSAIIGYWYVRRRRCPPHDDDDAEVSRSQITFDPDSYVFRFAH